MNRKPITQAKDPWLAGALPALRRARQRAEEIARDTGTSLVLAKDGRPVRVRPGPAVRGESRDAR
jgi:hypothetical protein